MKGGEPEGGEGVSLMRAQEGTQAAGARVVQVAAVLQQAPVRPTQQLLLSPVAANHGVLGLKTGRTKGARAVTTAARIWVVDAALHACGQKNFGLKERLYFSFIASVFSYVKSCNEEQF
jgi:hypothetical protein